MSGRASAGQRGPGPGSVPASSRDIKEIVKQTMTKPNKQTNKGVLCSFMLYLQTLFFLSFIYLLAKSWHSIHKVRVSYAIVC